jgi:hypothetical protein
MVDRRHIEGRIIDIVRRVVGGEHVEDDYVECKAAWPTEHKRIARRIAGLANSARGAHVLLIIGLDEDGHTVTELDETDLASWWDQVCRHFADGITPDLTSVRVPTEFGAVMGLAFATDRSPYLVTTDGIGGVSREVPWRSGTGIRTAKRHELLSLLIPASATPEIEFIDPVLYTLGTGPTAEDDSSEASLEFTCEVFFEATDRVMLPRHHWSLEAQAPELDDEPVFLGMHFSPYRVKGWSDADADRMRRPKWENEPEHPYGVHVRESGLIVNGSEALQLKASATLDLRQAQRVDDAPYFNINVSLPTTRGLRVSSKLRFQHRIPTSADREKHGFVTSIWVPQDE